MLITRARGECSEENGRGDAGGRTKERVKSSGSWSQCFGEKDIKDEGRCEKETWTGGCSSRKAEIAEKWGTLDKMKNGMENG